MLEAKYLHTFVMLMTNNICHFRGTIQNAHLLVICLVS